MVTEGQVLVGIKVFYDSFEVSWRKNTEARVLAVH